MERSATAQLSNYRQSPRKVRLVATLIRNKRADNALDILDFATKRSAEPIKKLLLSAIANAKNAGLSTENLIIKEIRVDAGPVLKRMMPRARGRGFQILKRSSRVMMTLTESAGDASTAPAVAAPKKAEKVEKKPVKTAKTAKKETK